MLMFNSLNYIILYYSLLGYYPINFKFIAPTNFTIYNLIVYLFFIFFFFLFYQHILKKNNILLLYFNFISIFLKRSFIYLNSLYLIVLSQIANRTQSNSSRVSRTLNSLSSSSSGPSSPRPPKKNWREKIKNHLLKYQRSYGLYSVLILSGLGYTVSTDIDLIHLKDVITYNIEMESINEVDHFNRSSYWSHVSRDRDIYNFIDSQFSDILRVNKIINNLQLGLSTAFTLLGFSYQYLDPVYILQGLLKYNNELFNSEEASKLFLIHYFNFNFIHKYQDYIKVFQLIDRRDLLKGTNVLTHYLTYENFLFLLNNYNKILAVYEIDGSDINYYFNISKMALNINSELELAVYVFKNDLNIALNLRSQHRVLDNNTLSTMMVNQFINVLYGFHYDKIPQCIVKNGTELNHFKWLCFIQSLRTYYEFMNSQNGSFNIELNDQDYRQFYSFYVELSRKFNVGANSKFSNQLNMDFVEFSNLITSLNFQDFYELENVEIQLPTTISSSLPQKMSYLKSLKESSLLQPTFDE